MPCGGRLECEGCDCYYKGSSCWNEAHGYRRFVNLLGKKILMCDIDGNLYHNIESEGEVEVEVKTSTRDIYNGSIYLPVCSKTYGDIKGLPEPKEEVIFIVKIEVLKALRDKNVVRTDLVAPDLGPYSTWSDSIKKDSVIISNFITL